VALFASIEPDVTFLLSGGMCMSGALLPTRLADLARGDLAWLRGFLI